MTRTPSASAQAQEPLDASTARFHFGPLFVSPALTLKELGVDTNVFNSNDNPQSDFTFTLVPQARALMKLGRRVTVNGTGGADLVYYAVYANQRYVGGNYDVRMDVAANRLTFFVGDSLLNTRDRPTNEIDIRPRHTDHGTTGGVDFKLHDKVSLELAGHRAQLRYDPNAFYDGVFLGQSLDLDTQSVSANAKYRLTPYTTINVLGDVTQDRFTENTIRDSNSVSIRPGVTFSPRALISGYASAGVRSFQPRTTGVPAYTGVVAEAGLTYRLNGATILNGTADRDLSYSYANATPYYIHTDIGLNLRRELVGRFDATVGAVHSLYDYKALATSPAFVPSAEDRQDTTINYLFDVGYRANRKTRIGFGVESWHRTSNQQSDRAYTGFRFRSTANVAF